MAFIHSHLYQTGSYLEISNDFFITTSKEGVKPKKTKKFYRSAPSPQSRFWQEGERTLCSMLHAVFLKEGLKSKLFSIPPPSFVGELNGSNLIGHLQGPLRNGFR
jgi:hypothetical protein